MDALTIAFKEVFQIHTLLLMAVGVTAGIVTGAIPGFTITMAVALALPFTFGMDPITGVAVLMSVVAGGASGGLIPSCLLGIPGTPSSIATVFDVYPMVKKGEPGKALAVGLWSGFFGMLIAGAALILFAPLLANWALEFGPWEMFALMFFGMTSIASVAGDSLAKGLLQVSLDCSLRVWEWIRCLDNTVLPLAGFSFTAGLIFCLFSLEYLHFPSFWRIC